ELPAGPGVAGTTGKELYGAFHLNDGFLVQPDIHFASGLVCIDCHTVLEAHGDGGNIDTQMALTTEICCEDCHGDLSGDSKLMTSRGNPLPQLRREGDLVVLHGKLDDQDHVVLQVRQLVDPDSPFYLRTAAQSMTPDHLRAPGEGGLECYSCHAVWQPTDAARVVERDFAAAGTAPLTGASAPGAIARPDLAYPSRPFLLRYRPFSLGRNSRGRVSPFLQSEAGFLATARDGAS